MKRYILTLVALLTAMVSVSAMSYQRAREEALYLTDKMAYELNLNDQQYNDAYEINLDYFLSMESERDLYEDYLSYRLTDFRHILLNWQFDLLLQADYFVRPLLWSRGCWVFPIYGHYHRNVFFYDRPHVYFEYRGGHGHRHFHGDFYADRRPHWDGGMRGREPMGGREPMRGREPMGGPGRNDGRMNPSRGNGYHFDLPAQGNRNDRRNGQPGDDERHYGQPGRNDNRMNNSRGVTTTERERTTNRGGEYNVNRGTTQPNRNYNYRGNDSRQSQSSVGTRSYDRSYSTPNRNSGSSTRSTFDAQPKSRGNSFSRSSSRATTSSTPVTRGGGPSGGNGAHVSRGRR